MTRKDRPMSASARRAWHGEMQSDISYIAPDEKVCGEGHARLANPGALAPMHTAYNLLDRAVSTGIGRPVCPTCHRHFDSTMGAWAHCWMTVCNPPVER
jgi:hypothetical protein